MQSIDLKKTTSIRELESLRQTGDLLTGVQLKDGGRLRIESNCVNVELPEELPIQGR